MSNMSDWLSDLINLGISGVSDDLISEITNKASSTASTTTSTVGSTSSALTSALTSTASAITSVEQASSVVSNSASFASAVKECISSHQSVIQTLEENTNKAISATKSIISSTFAEVSGEGKIQGVLFPNLIEQANDQANSANDNKTKQLSEIV